MRRAIIPAAGRSSRLGRAKALLRFGDSTVAQVLLQTLRQAGFEDSTVVIAAGDRALASHCRAIHVKTAINRRPELGMLGSILRGLGTPAASRNPRDVVMICPIDYPALAAATLERMADVIEAGETELVVPASSDGRRGHPLALAATLVPEVRALSLDAGLKQLLQRRQPLELQVEDPAIHLDIDTWSDYLELVSAART